MEYIHKDIKYIMKNSEGYSVYKDIQYIMKDSEGQNLFGVYSQGLSQLKTI